MAARILQIHNKALLGVISLVLFISIVLLHQGLYPTVFSDEWIYSSSSRLLSLKDAIIPSYLYLTIFKTSNYCGTGFLECARLGNAFFYTVSLPFIYLIARRVCSNLSSLFITTIFLLGPISSYTSYFMPESLYFFTFWLLSWFTLNSLNKSPLLIGIGNGFILCVMSFVKVHAIFILLAISIFYLWMFNAKKSIQIITLILLTFLILRFFSGWLIAGFNGLDLIGVKYHYNATSLFHLNRFFSMLPLLLIPLIGNISTLCLLFNLPFILLLTAKNQLIPFKKYIICCLTILIMITSLTTAQIVGWDAYETIGRLHLRYYNFTFALFYIIAAANLTQESNKSSLNWLWAILALLIMLISYVYLPIIYQLSFIDCPELYGLFYHSFWLKLILVINAISLLLWTVKPKWGIRVYVFLYCPFYLLTTNYFVHHELYQTRYHHSDDYDKAGHYTRLWLGKDAKNLVVIGSERAGLFKALFYIDSPHIKISEIADGVPVEFAKIPKETEWVLVIGNHPILKKPVYRIAKDNFSLIRIAKL